MLARQRGTMSVERGAKAGRGHLRWTIQREMVGAGTPVRFAIWP